MYNWYEACCLFIVKAVCFGQIRASPIVFQVRYVLGGWCYIMVPLSIFPWFPGWFLQVHLTWTPMYMRHPQNSYHGVLFGWVWKLSIIFNSRRHSYMEAGYNHVPCRFSSFSSADIQGIGGWAKLNKSTPFSTFEILAAKGRTTERPFVWRTL